MNYKADKQMHYT